MTTESQTGQQYQLTTKEIFGYVALWGIIFGVINILRAYSSIGAKGAYSYSAALVTDFVLPIAIGLVFVAIGIAISYLLGKKEHTWVVGVWCFLAGCLAIPVMVGVIMILFALGVIVDN